MEADSVDLCLLLFGNGFVLWPILNVTFIRHHKDILNVLSFEL